MSAAGRGHAAPRIRLSRFDKRLGFSVPTPGGSARDRLGDEKKRVGCAACASGVLAKLGDELRWRDDRQLVPQAEEVLVAGDKEGAAAEGEPQQVVAVRKGLRYPAGSADG
jgi:hypothetical protein